MIQIKEWVTNHMPFAPDETKIVMIDNVQPGDNFDKAEVKTFRTHLESLNFVKKTLRDHLVKDITILIDLCDMLITDSNKDYRGTQKRKEALARLTAGKRWIKEDNPKLSDIMDAAIKMKPYFDVLQPDQNHPKFKDYQFLNEQIFNASYGWLNTL